MSNNHDSVKVTIVIDGLWLGVVVTSAMIVMMVKLVNVIVSGVDGGGKIIIDNASMVIDGNTSCDDRSCWLVAVLVKVTSLVMLG